jgi:hypothetical protein
MQDLKRCLLVLAAVAMAAACMPGYRSAIDLAPASLRSATSPLPDGVYCLALISWRSDGEPVAVVNGDKNNCMRYAWDAARRVARVEGFASQDGEPEPTEFAVVPLGDGIFLTQTGEPPAADDELYDIALAVIEGGAVGAVPALGTDEARSKLAKRFPAVILGPEDTGEGYVTAGSYIRSGDLTAVHAYFRDAARLALSSTNEDGGFSLAMMVRVDAPLQETVFSLLNRADVVALKRKMLSLARSAPQGVEPGPAQWSMPFPFN